MKIWLCAALLRVWCREQVGRCCKNVHCFLSQPFSALRQKCTLFLSITIFFSVVEIHTCTLFLGTTFSCSVAETYIVYWYSLFLLPGRNVHYFLVQPFLAPCFQASLHLCLGPLFLIYPYTWYIYIYMFCKDEYIYVYEYVLAHVNLRVCYFYVLVCLFFNFLFVVGCFFHRERERSALPHASLCNETVDIDRVTHNKFPLFIDNTSCPPQNLWK